MNYELYSIIEKLVKCEIKEHDIGLDKISVRCPICGDSSTDKRMKRGIFLFGEEPYYYYCHNGGCPASSGIPAVSMMKKHYPVYYKEYTKSYWKGKKSGSAKQNNDLIKTYSRRYLESKKLHSVVLSENQSSSLVNFSKPDIMNLIKNNIDMKLFKKGTKEVTEFVKSRNLPEKYNDILYYCDNGRYFKKRIIIPFESKNEIYYFQGRSIAKEIPKYKNPVSDYKPFYNIFNIDQTKEVMILEGPIDSFFIKNSIAIIGTNNSDDKKLDLLNAKYIFDNDITGCRKSLKYLEKGKTIFLWKKFLKALGVKIFNSEIKDINDLYMKGILKDELNYDDLKEYFTKNYNNRALI